jgi:hypothetical protein
MTDLKPRLAKEVVDKEFGVWLEKMGLVDKCDPSSLDDEDKRVFAAHAEVVKRAMRNGSAVLNDNGELVFTPTISEDKTPITFHEPTASDLRAGDQVKATEFVLRQQKILGSMTQTSASRFADMNLRDFTVCESVLSLFLAK